MDVNGNGQQDEIILVDCQTFANGLAQVFGLGNGIVALDTANGKIVSPWYQDHVKDYFAYVNQLIQDGIIDSATVGSTDLQNQRLADNLVGSWYAYDGATYLDAYVTNNHWHLFLENDNIRYGHIFSNKLDIHLLM